MTETAQATGVLLVAIPGEPVPKGRPRFNRRTGRAITPERTVSGESIVAWHVKEAAQQQGFILPLLANLHVSLSFGSKAKPGKWPDLDNCTKLVLDSLNGVAWIDDRQVVRLSAVIAREMPDGVEPWTTIEIRAETPPEPAADAAGTG
jgi:crossover junction endodeoxyribonuclease RusA